MKYILIYLWHGEDLGKRLLLGLTAVSAALAHGGAPDNLQSWIAMVVLFLTATTSKNDKKAANLGRKHAV